MFCPNCGAESEAPANFCWSCGNSFQATGAESKTQPITIVSDGIEYAGFFKRVAAFVVDLIIVTIGSSPIFFAFSFIYNLSTGRPAQILSILLTWLYYAGMESSERQATLGKTAMGIIVTDLDGEKISFAQASGRHFCKILSVLTMGIGFLMIGFTEEKQALHDKIADCLVVVKQTKRWVVCNGA